MVKDVKTVQFKKCPDLLSRYYGFINSNPAFSAFLSDRYTVFPGFCDVHVHFREPGFSYKETIATGSLAAAHGGYTAVCTMPNLNPVPDCVENLSVQEEIIRSNAIINVYPYCSITHGEKGEELVDMDSLKNKAIAFSDDGRGIQNEDLMLKAMKCAKRAGKIIAAHCEDNSLLHGGYIHDGAYSAAHNHRGISSESEWRQLRRDLELVRVTGCSYHACHISTKESVDLIRKAKADGLDVTCETAPHYLVFDENDLVEDGRFKMNPPLRGKADRLALTEAVVDGTVDMIATDHAPHSEAEKAKGLEGSAFGVTGLETAFPALYTYLVKKGVINTERLLDLLVLNPRKRFNIPQSDDFSVWDLNEEYIVNSNEFLSKGKSTPFEGVKLFGRCLLTVCNGKVAYSKQQ